MHFAKFCNENISDFKNFTEGLGSKLIIYKLP